MPSAPEVVHFLHVGKTGGTAMVHALNEYRICIQSPRRLQNSPYALHPARADGTMLICVHPHDETMREVPNGQKLFFCLRDPIGRFVSGFSSRKRQGWPRYNSPWSPGEREAFERFATTDLLATALDASDADERSQAHAAMAAIQHVRDSYWHWFIDEAYLRSRADDVLFVGFQESLDSDFARLKELLGLAPGIGLPADDVAAFRNPETKTIRLSERAMSNLRSWYKNDYALVSLCRHLFRPDLAT